MWVFSSKENTWINADRSLRLFRDGSEGWAFMMEDGRAVHITNEEYELAMRGIDPDYYKKHPNVEKHPTFDIEKAFKELENAVLDKKKKDTD